MNKLMDWPCNPGLPDPKSPSHHTASTHKIIISYKRENPCQDPGKSKLCRHRAFLLFCLQRGKRCVNQQTCFSAKQLGLTLWVAGKLRVALFFLRSSYAFCFSTH